MSGRWLSEKALAQLRSMPRVGITNLRPPDGSPFPGQKPRRSGCKTHGFGRNAKSPEARMLHQPIGAEWLRVPLAYRVPKEPHYNYGYSTKRQYPPVSLKQLQLLIDTGRLDPSKPIDLATICNSKVFPINPQLQHFGVNLTEEGADCFEARVNIEVQWASEQTIAAVEKNGGMLTAAYFDVMSVTALSNPRKWFQSGKPVPRRLLPPQDCMEFYSNAANRGYLADPREISQERIVLGQKYGYEPVIFEDKAGIEGFMAETKDPKQVFYGLEPGWIVDLMDKVIYKPKDEELTAYYKS